MLSGANTSTDTTLFNGRENTNAALALASGSVSQSNIDCFPVFQAANMFAPSGTTAGDWYIPSAKEVDFLVSSGSVITAQKAKISSADSTVCNQYAINCPTSTSYDNSYPYWVGVFSNYNLVHDGYKKSYLLPAWSAHPMISI